MPAPTSPSPRPAGSFWQRRLLGPIKAQLTQGITPDRIALTLAVSTACSLLPFLGFTSLLNLGIGVWLRLNQPIMQTLNQLLGPLQLLMIVVYVRIGEKIWGAPAIPISVSTLMNSFRESPKAFFQRFAWSGVHAATAWVISIPIIVGTLYFVLRPIIRRAASAVKFKAAI